jgi:hypothetical protein
MRKDAEDEREWAMTRFAGGRPGVDRTILAFPVATR